MMWQSSVEEVQAGPGSSGQVHGSSTFPDEEPLTWDPLSAGGGPGRCDAAEAERARGGRQRKGRGGRGRRH